jgi:hypothetical protein
MPLAFTSLSHGEIAFGFFNIETDMLLLDRHFFFADDFCAAVGSLTRGGITETASLDAYTLEPAAIGNLMGAIHGIDLGGFIGEVYRKFPFPADQDKFRQQPEGVSKRGIMENIIRKYAGINPVSIVIHPAHIIVECGGYTFDRHEFQRLILYVWAGGYPRWRDNIRPEYVMEMKKSIEESHNPLFDGLHF